MFIDVVVFVGHREDFGFVDVVDLERFEDLGFDEVADADFSHDGNGDGFLDFFDEGWIAHAGDATFFSNIGGNAFERHDGDGAGFLGDARLFGIDDVHDDAAFEHLREVCVDFVAIVHAIS